MNNISTFFTWTVGLLITISIVGLGIGLWNNVQPVFNVVNNQAHAQARLMEQAEFSPYDYQIVSGSQLISAQRRYTYMDSFHIYIDTISAGTFGTTPGYGSTTCPDINVSTGEISLGSTMSCGVEESDLRDQTSSYYIAPQDRFRSIVVKDANDRVAGLLFVEL